MVQELAFLNSIDYPHPKKDAASFEGVNKSSGVCRLTCAHGIVSDLTALDITEGQV